VVNLIGAAQKLSERDAVRRAPRGARAPTITYIFRRRSPAVFSIENLFDALYAHFEQSGARIRRLELPHVSTGIISVVRNAWYVARHRNKGQLHITGDVHYAALFCPFTRTIVTIHDCVVLQRGAGFKRFVMRVLWFWLPLRFASAITVISAQTKDEVLKTAAIPVRKITVIPNFVHPAFAFGERPFAAEQPHILHVGTTPNKNLSRVIAALRNIPCVLVIVGEMTRATLMQLEDCAVNFQNFVGIDQEAMVRLYREADIVSFPSTYEGFGMPILEGQSVGRAVLTSDLDPMRSVAGPGGALLVDPHSVDAIREGFLALIGDGLMRARLIAAGRENCSRFTLQTVAASYLAVYQKLNER
jgi:glycosyltransferase involved in cell wall biosynthesis